MEIKDKPLRQPADSKKDKSPADEPKNKFNSLLKQRINIFLINYFNYLVLVLALVIFAAGLFLFIYPPYQQIVKNGKTVEKSLQTDYETKAGYLRDVRDLKSSYQPISEANRKKIEDMVPVGNEVTGLISEIESMVLKNGAILNSIKVGSEDPKSQPKTETTVESGKKQESLAGIFEQLPAEVGLARIEINLSSVNYQVLKNLLETFENNLPLMDIAKLDYDVQGNKVVFTVYSYYLLN